MALSRRTGGRFQASIWPGFVDAMTGLLLVLMFVLTIFMVIQFALRETISGQEDQLTELSNEVASLSAALGFERDRSAALGQQVGALSGELGALQSALSDARGEVTAQNAIIAQLTAERDAQFAAMQDAQARITGFEAQVAGLLAERADNLVAIETLEAQRSDLITAQEALNLALAQARDEIDAEAEAARLAAARADALQALADNLETEAEAAQTQISELEAAQLVDAAAAEELRQRLADADAELTAMSLALEEKRQEAEDTLTLLAAAEAARDNLDQNLAIALLAQEQAQDALTQLQAEQGNLGARLAAALLAEEALSDELALLQEQKTQVDTEFAAALALQQSTQEELAAAQALAQDANLSRESIAAQLAAALLEREQGQQDLDEARRSLEQLISEQTRLEDIEAQLAAAVLARQDAEQVRESLEAQLAAAVVARRAAELEETDIRDQLAQALLAAQQSQAEMDATRAQQATLEERLAEAVASLTLSQSQAQEQLTQAERQAALLAQANQRLSQEEALSAESQRRVAALNEQVAALRGELSRLQSLLNLANEDDASADVQIESLTQDLNTAMARALLAERRARELEQAETERLATEAAELERFRSDFFGQLRDVVEGQEGVQISGDRFVFSSEVLFEPGKAELSRLGQLEIAKVASILREISDRIPEEIDWVIRVDGHTDNVPLSGLGEFSDNWELSQARALSVVRYMTDFLGIPPNRLAANGFGQYQPLAAGDDDASRAQNRRIELKLTER